MLFTSKIRDREEGIVIYLFYTWFSVLLFSNALGDTAYSQEHLKTMVYAKFGGQT